MTNHVFKNLIAVILTPIESPLIKIPLWIKNEERVLKEHSKYRFYKNIHEYLAKNAELPNWRNGSTPLDEHNMWRVNNEIKTKYDDVELDLVKKVLIFKSDGLNKKIISLDLISQVNYTHEDKSKVDKINNIENKINSLSLDFGMF